MLRPAASLICHCKPQYGLFRHLTMSFFKSTQRTCQEHSMTVMMTTLPVVFLACADSFVFKRWMHAQPRCESTKHACLPGCHKFVCTWVCDPWAFYDSRWLKAKAHVVIVKTDFTATTLKSCTRTSHIPNTFTRPLYVSSLHLRGVKLSQNFYSCTRGAQADDASTAQCT